MTKIGSGFFRLADERGNRHQAFNCHMLKRPQLWQDAFGLIVQEPSFALLFSHINFQQNILAQTSCLGTPIDLLSEFQAIDRMDQIKGTDDRTNFPALKRTDKVPSDRLAS